MPTPTRCVLALAALSLALPAPCQAPVLTPLGAPIPLAASARALATVDGVPHAGGAAWAATFGVDGVTFVPALGRRAPATRPVRLQLVAVARRGGEPVAVAPAAPRTGRRHVDDRHGPVLARYDVLASGLEQSFHFAALPPGDGDLVVTLHAHTELQARSDSPRELLFTSPHGGVAMRGVVGVDAAGARADGTMRALPANGAAAAVELVLPAAFVDRAALPLVLDPMIGTVVVPGAGPDESYGDVAYEPTTDTFLVVWDRSFSLLNIDLVAQRLDGGGNLLGPLLTVRAGVTGLSRNRVAAVDARDTFVVAWSEGFATVDASVAGVHAATGAISTPLLLASNATQPDVGVASPQDDAAIVVWNSAPVATVRGARVTVGAAGALSIGPPVDVSPPGGGAQPSLSRGRANGRLLVAYRDLAGTRVDGAVIDANVQVLAAVTLVPATPALHNPAIDGDGDQWLCAYEIGNNLTVGDLFTKRVTFDAGSGSIALGPVVPLATSATFSERHPAVGWLGNAAAVGFVRADFVSPSYVSEAAAGTVDAVSCAACETPAAAVTRGPGYGHFDPRVAVRRAAAGAAGEVLLVYHEDDPVAGVTLNARRFRSDDGLEWDRAGGCGGGAAGHTCARTGNGGYSLRLTGAPPSQPALLLLGTATIHAACGPCVVVPDPATGASLLVATTAAGSAAVALPIPAQAGLVGYSFHHQWLTFAPGGPCFGVVASNALEVQLQ